MLLLVTVLYCLLAFTYAITCDSLMPMNDSSPVTFFTLGPISCNLTFTAPLGLSVTCAINFSPETPNCITDRVKFLGGNNFIISGPFCGTNIFTATTVSTSITVDFKISSPTQVLICSVRQLSFVPTSTIATTKTPTLTTTTTSTTPPTATTSTTPPTATTSTIISYCNSITNLNTTSTAFKLVGPCNCYFTFNSPTRFSKINCSMEFSGFPPSSNCTADQLSLFVGNNFVGGPFCGKWNLTVDTRSTSLTFRTTIGSSESYLVCNVQPSNPISTPTPTTTMTASPTEPSSCSCGIDSASRIIGGTNALPYQYPWQVRLNMFSSNTSDYSLCGGTLISSNYVLTAAHCVEGNIRAKIFIGDHSTAAADSYEVVLNSTSLIKHHLWSPLTLANDIALIRFPSPITFSPGIQPACLPFKYVNSSFAGKTCTVTGWGRTNDSNGDTATILQRTNVTIIENVVCAETWISYLLPTMICAQQPGTATCHGDSGGPLGYNAPTEVENQDRTYVIGVVSFGNANGCTVSPNVFTRVTSYLSWIESTTRETFCNL